MQEMVLHTITCCILVRSPGKRRSMTPQHGVSVAVHAVSTYQATLFLLITHTHTRTHTQTHTVTHERLSRRNVQVMLVLVLILVNAGLDARLVASSSNVMLISVLISVLNTSHPRTLLFFPRSFFFYLHAV